MQSSLLLCHGCDNQLSQDAFYYSKKGRRDSRCKECRSKYYYQNKVNVSFSGHRTNRQRIIEEIILPLKAQGCADCHQIFLPEAMDLDHVRGIKKFSISQLATLPISDQEMISLLEDELLLCEVCCANCHRKRTISRYKTSARMDYIDKKFPSKTLNEKVIYAYDVLSSQSCIDCGTEDLLVLEFDHVRLSKTAALSKMFWKSKYSLLDVKEEIAKCEVRCVICHRIKTHEQALQNKKTNQNTARKTGEGFCACGERKDSHATECRNCYKLSISQTNKYPSLDELILGVEKHGWKPYASMLGFSDNGLRKIAKKLGADPLPRKK